MTWDIISLVRLPNNKRNVGAQDLPIYSRFALCGGEMLDRAQGDHSQFLSASRNKNNKLYFCSSLHHYC